MRCLAILSALVALVACGDNLGLSGATDVCGDGRLGDGESCDGSNLGGASCASLDQGGGRLRCADDCTFDVSDCYSLRYCGDGARDHDELCDGEDLAGQTCADVGFDSGQLACSGNCSSFDTGACFFCDIEAIAGETVLTADVDVAYVTLTVSYDGGVFPEDPGRPRGTLSLTGEHDVAIELDDQGAIELTVAVVPGSYRVTLTSAPDSTVLSPDQTYVLADSLAAVAGGQAVELDLAAKSVSGTVAFDSQPRPDGQSGRLEFLRAGTVARAVVPSTGAASYSVDLTPGTYSVRYVSASDGPALSTGQRALIGELVVTATAIFDVDIATAELSVSWTINGESPAANGASGASRGKLLLLHQESGGLASVALGASGDQVAAKVVPGTYDVYFDGGAAAVQDVLPQPALRVASGVAVAGNLARDYDLEVVTLTLEYPTLPAVSLFQLRGPTLNTVTALDSGGDTSSMDVQLYPGEYDVWVSVGGTGEVLPVAQDLVEADVDLTAVEQATVTIASYATATWSGQVRIDGAAMLDDGELDGQPRGYLVLVDKAAAAQYRFPVGETGTADFVAFVFEGSYDVYFESAPSLHQDALPPGQRVPVQQDKVLGSTSEGDIELTTGTVSGQVLVDGGAMVDDAIDDGEDRGWIWFSGLGGISGPEPVAIGELGPASFELWLFEGDYQAAFVSNLESVQSALPSGQVTVVDELVPVAGSSAVTYDIETAHLQVTLTANGEAVPSDQRVDGEPRGWLRLVRAAGAALPGFAPLPSQQWFRLSLAESGDAIAAGRVFVGGYQIDVVTGEESTQDALPPSWTTRLFTSCAY